MSRYAIIITAMWALGPATAGAQAPGTRAPADDQAIHIGISLGLVRADIGGDIGFGEFTPKLGAMFGAALRYEVSESVAFQPELAYAMKGAIVGASFGEGETFSLDYLHVPLLVRVRVVPEGRMIPVLFGGPALGLLLRASSEGEDVKNTVNNVDVGVVLGAALEFPTAKGSVLVGARYEIGLLPLPENDDDGEFTNRALTMTVGYLF